MAMNKLNTFHWHFSDTQVKYDFDLVQLDHHHFHSFFQSFPLKLPTVPQLAEYGAYYDDQVYLLEDLVELELHAKLLGIRILPELDTPAHAANGWQFGEIQGLGKLGLCINLRWEELTLALTLTLILTYKSERTGVVEESAVC